MNLFHSIGKDIIMPARRNKRMQKKAKQMVQELSKDVMSQLRDVKVGIESTVRGPSPVQTWKGRTEFMKNYALAQWNRLESMDFRRFKENSIQFAKSLWQRDGWQKLVITAGLGLCTLVAATIAEDRGRQISTLRAHINEQKASQELLTKEIAQNQRELDESRLRLILAEQNFQEDQKRLRLAMQQSVLAKKTAKTKLSSKKKVTYQLTKKPRKRMVAQKS